MVALLQCGMWETRLEQQWIGQLEARENSGSITVSSGGAGRPPNSPSFGNWKPADRSNIRARSPERQSLRLPDAQELFDQINNRCRSGATERFYCGGQLHYNGLAWRGELWLDDTLRLGPPSQQYETALTGPRVIIVDALVDCAGLSDTQFVFSESSGNCQPSSPW